jgi:hypothetical protein
MTEKERADQLQQINHLTEGLIMVEQAYALGFKRIQDETLTLRMELGLTEGQFNALLRVVTIQAELLETARLRRQLRMALGLEEGSNHHGS